VRVGNAARDAEPGDSDTGADVQHTGAHP
jgi:hypothetical protein